MKLNWNSLGGGRMQNKKPSIGGVWIFSKTAYYHILSNGAGDKSL